MGLFKVGAACSPDITDTHATLLVIVKIISVDDESRIKCAYPWKTATLPKLNRTLA